MTSKLRRPALFGCDGRLGPVIDYFPKKNVVMEVSLAAGTFGGSSTTSTTSDAKHSDSKSPKAVNFEEGEEHLDRKKYLTAKYGSHQMSLIRKRLGVEMWMLDALSKLYTHPKAAKELDLDEVLDIDDDSERRCFVADFLADSNASTVDIEKFIDDLMVQTHKL